MNTLYVAWQAPLPTRAWFPIGRLDADLAASEYVFQYTQGALRAQEIAGFAPLMAFPDLQRRYASNELFPLFKNRVLASSRRDFQQYLTWLDLDPSHADPIEILALTGGARQTDSLEVFPKFHRSTDGAFVSRFFLHGSRHVAAAASQRIATLERGEPLQVALELNNPATGHAIQLQTADGHLVGWAPRYLVEDLRMAMLDEVEVRANVRRVNLVDAPAAHRVLVELTGHGRRTFKPTLKEEFQLLHG